VAEGPACRPGLNTYECAVRSYERLRSTVKGQREPWVSLRDVPLLLGLSTLQLRNLRRTRPELGRRLPIYDLEGKRPYMSIYDIWEEARWVRYGDICRALNVKEATLERWVTFYGLLRSEKRELHRVNCCPLEDVLSMRIRLIVKGLVGHRLTPWGEIDAWVSMGPSAVTREAARQAVEELKEVPWGDGDG